MSYALRRLILYIPKNFQHFKTSPRIVLNSIYTNITSHGALKVRPVYQELNSAKSYVLYGFSLMTLLGFEKQLSIQDEIILNIKKSILMIEHQDYNKAEKMLHITLRLAQQTQNELAVTYIYDVMANMALDQNFYEKAEKLFKDVIHRLTLNGIPETDLRIVHISMKLSYVYQQRGILDKAAIGFRFCLDNLKFIETMDEPTEDHIKLLCIAKNWYGSLLAEMNERDEALKLLSESFELMKQFPEESAKDMIMCLNNMATIYERMDNLTEAEKLLKQAIEIGKEVPKMHDLGAIYINLGRLYLRNKLYEKARHSCGYGWKLCKDRKNAQCKEEGFACLREIRAEEW